MASIIIRRLDDAVKAQLRIRAAHHGRSMEEEAREILKAELSSTRPGKANLVESIRRRAAAVGGVELTLPVREPVRRPPDMSK